MNPVGTAFMAPGPVLDPRQMIPEQEEPGLDVGTEPGAGLGGYPGMDGDIRIISREIYQGKTFDDWDDMEANVRRLARKAGFKVVKVRQMQQQRKLPAAERIGVPGLVVGESRFVLLARVLLCPVFCSWVNCCSAGAAAASAIVCRFSAVVGFYFMIFLPPHDPCARGPGWTYYTSRQVGVHCPSVMRALCLSVRNKREEAKRERCKMQVESNLI